jgi:hypothetical protein
VKRRLFSRQESLATMAAASAAADANGERKAEILVR